LHKRESVCISHERSILLTPNILPYAKRQLSPVIEDQAHRIDDNPQRTHAG